MPWSAADETSRSAKVRSGGRIDGGAAVAGDGWWDISVGCWLAPASRESGSVQRVVDGLTKGGVAKEWTPRIEDDLVDDRLRLKEVPLGSASSSGALRPVAPVERSARREHRVRVEVGR